MSKEEVMLKMNDILRDIFEDENINIDNSTTTKDIEGWDSICKMMFAGEVQNAFNIKLSAKDLLALNEFGPFADAILEKLNS